VPEEGLGEAQVLLQELQADLLPAGAWQAPRRFQVYTAKTHYRNMKQIFPEKELHGLSPNFHIQVFVSDFVYIPTISLPFLLQENTYVELSWEYKHRSQTLECGNFWD
jgi:hypothetical protein